MPVPVPVPSLSMFIVTLKLPSSQDLLGQYQMNTRPSPSDGYFPLLYMYTSLAHPRPPRCNASPESVEFPSAHSGVQQLEMCCIAPHRDAQLLSSTYHLLSRFPRQLIPRHYMNSVVKRNYHFNLETSKLELLVHHCSTVRAVPLLSQSPPLPDDRPDLG